MGQLTVCPPAAEPGDITASSCPFDVGQIQKLIFQRKTSAGATLNVMTVGDAALLATWTGLLTAANSTKVQVTPFVHNPQSEPGGVIEHGSGNEVVDGIPFAMGQEPTAWTFEFKRISAASKESMVSWEGEDMAVYMIDEHGRIWGLTDSTASPSNFYGIPVYSQNIGDRRVGGKVDPDINTLTFRTRARWDNKLHPITPSDFAALTGLAGS